MIIPIDTCPHRVTWVNPHLIEMVEFNQEPNADYWLRVLQSGQVIACWPYGSPAAIEFLIRYNAAVQPERIRELFQAHMDGKVYPIHDLVFRDGEWWGNCTPLNDWEELEPLQPVCGIWFSEELYIHLATGGVYAPEEA